MSGSTFINYSHPDESASSLNRRRVAKHIGTHYRNRSAPATKIAARQRLEHSRTLAPAATSHRKTSASAQNDGSDSPSAHSVLRDHLGLRDDPFGVFPTSRSNAVGVVVDYYFHIYAPAHLIRPELISIEAGDELLKAHFRYALQRPVLFESILALSYSNLAIMPRTKAESDAPFMYHYGQAINHIRRALAAGYIGDAVLFAIISLLAINYLRNDLTAFQSNLQGLRQIITLRGGLNALGWPALLKPGILTVESFWTYLSNQAHLLDHCTVPAILTNDSLPSPEAGVECITPNLPTGFRILAEQGRLNRIVLEIVQREVIFEASLSRTPPSYFAYHDGIRKFTHLKARDGNEITVASNLQTCEELARLIVSPDLMPLDIICCIGMLINSLCVTRNEQLSPIFFTQLQYHAKQLIAVDLDDNDVAARDLKTWTIFNIASTMVSESSTYSFDKHHNDMRLALAVKVVKHFSKKSWEDVQSILQQFICSESCIDAFKNVWDFGSQYMGQQIRKLPASG